MASIETMTTATGELRYRVRFRVNGRTVEQWFKTMKAAKACKVRTEADAQDGAAFDPRAGARTLDAYFAEWVPSRLVKGRPLTPSTRLGYERLYKRNIKPIIGAKALRTLRPDKIRLWYAEVATRSGSDQAAKSYRLLRAVLATAETDQVIRQNPCRIRGGGEEHAVERPMVPTSLVLDLADSIEDRYRALVLLAGFGGLRTGENLGLRRLDVDVLHREVRVVQQAQEVTGQGRVTLDPKSDAGRRVVALPSLVVQALERHLEAYTPADGDAAVFRGPDGGPLRRASLSAAWRAAVTATGAPEGLRLHDLRHHAATLAARTPGVTTKELMARIGHASPRAALIYQHSTRERDEAIASYLDEQVANVSRPKLASVVGLDGPPRGVGVGLAPARASKT